jgi:excisionase family DNA binding protein
MDEKNTIQDFISAEEAAKLLDIKKNTLYMLVSNKKINGYKPNGKKLYIRKSEILEWLNKGSKNAINNSKKE